MSHPAGKMTLKDRIREKTNKHGPYPHGKAVELYPEIAGTRCWLWTGTIGFHGYPQMSFKNKTLKIHKAVSRLRFGKKAKKKCTLHKCDVTNCIRPLHIFLGTTQENTADRDAKGRQASGARMNCPDRHGENHNRVKLSAKQVLKIRRLSKKGYTKNELGERYGVTPENIHRIVKRLTWTHI